MLNTKQIVVIVVVVVMIGALLAQPIKGLVDKQEQNTAAATEDASSMYTLKSVSELAKQGINSSLAQEISTIEGQVENAEGEEKVSLLQSLASKWEDLAKPIPQGFIYKEMAEVTPKLDYLVKAGDAFREGYTNQQDTALASALNKLAIESYQKAVDLDANNLAAKTGLGASLVTGSANPMAGIALLREVVQADPKNLDANKTLGLFSMQSGQFDRAIERFQTVIEIKADAESYFYLATAYEKIGQKSEAIAAFTKSKELAADPTLSQYIDRQIEALSK
ncbi:MAG: tetratricopeptide repeat protein [Sphingobacterium composti]